MIRRNRIHGLSACVNALAGEQRRCTAPTFVEYGENALDVCVDFRRGSLCGAGEVALGHIARRSARNERAGQRLSAHVFVVGATVNVYHIAGAMLHLLHSLGSEGEQWTLRWVRLPLDREGVYAGRKMGSRRRDRCVGGRGRRRRRARGRVGRVGGAAAAAAGSN